MRAKKRAEPEPTPADPEQAEYDALLEADVALEAYATGEVCSSCGLMVKPQWKQCPNCGGSKTRKRTDPSAPTFDYAKFKEGRGVVRAIPVKVVEKKEVPPTPPQPEAPKEATPSTPPKEEKSVASKAQ